MNGTAFALPPAATTTTPIDTRLLVAIASGLSFSPNGAPRDMFTTSMPSAWETLYAATHSRASTTRSVEPSQPNTLRATSFALGATPGPIWKAAGSL